MWWSRPGRLSVVFCFMSLLRSGVTFSGTQQIGGGSSEVAWNLEAEFLSVNLEEGIVYGTLSSTKPGSSSTWVSFWEGELVDNVHNFFHTDGRWRSTAESDHDHWSQFPAFHSKYRELFTLLGVDHLDVSQDQVRFMRWKETGFLKTGARDNLSYQGFYYVAIDVVHGEIIGFYFDPEMKPMQKLELHVKRLCDVDEGKETAPLELASLFEEEGNMLRNLPIRLFSHSEGSVDFDRFMEQFVIPFWC